MWSVESVEVSTGPGKMFREYGNTIKKNQFLRVCVFVKSQNSSTNSNTGNK